MQGGQFIFGGAPVCLVAATAAWGLPVTPPASQTWQLDVKFHDARRILVPFPGEAQPKPYWYLLYEVTNNTGRDVDFYPSFELVTDRLDVIKAGDGVHPRAFDAVFARHRKEFPFLARPTEVTGRLLQGAANARASVAVFRTFDPRASGFTVYGGGFSGDMKRVMIPTSKVVNDAAGSQRSFFLLRRTLAISYQLPGDPGTRAQAEPIRRERRWVMR